MKHLARPALAIIAGEGSLPQSLAEHCAGQGEPYRLFAVRGAVGEWAEAHSPHWFGLAELQELLAVLIRSGCQEVCLAGGVPRPSLKDLGGARALSGMLARIAGGLRAGDDALLRIVAEIVESQGLQVVGIEDRMPELLAPAGVIVGREPGEGSHADIRRGMEIVDALGALDVGQAAVVAEGRCLAVETVEGTQAMLNRLAGTGLECRGGASVGTGVLVKAPKPGQDLRFDRPAVGPDTLDAVVAAGLAGIAVEAGSVLVLERYRLSAGSRTGRGAFVYGFSREP